MIIFLIVIEFPTHVFHMLGGCVPVIFINEDLTARRASLARQTRSLKKDRKVTDCWTTGGNVMIKELNNKIRQVKSESDLKNY